jgi:NADH dehydrogenase
VQSGRHAAKNIRCAVAGRPGLPFRYVDKGSMATIGRHRAVARIGRFKFSGIVAWWLWLTVHVLSLVSYRSRLAVLTEWAFAYFTWARRSRVILEVPSEPTTLAKPSVVGQALRVDGEVPLASVPAAGVPQREAPRAAS